MSRFEAWSPEAAVPIVEHWKGRPGGWLPMAIAIQKLFGYIDDAAIEMMAGGLGTTADDVIRLVNGNQTLKREPPADHELKICLASPCRTSGGRELVDHVRETLGAGPGARTPDGRIDIAAPVFCFGRCALAPVIMIDGNPYGRVTEAQADGLLEGLD